MSLKLTSGSRLAPHQAQNGARPGYRAILHEECALGVLKDLFWFPGRSVRIGSHAPAQGAHPSAVEAPVSYTHLRAHETSEERRLRELVVKK